MVENKTQLFMSRTSVENSFFPIIKLFYKDRPINILQEKNLIFFIFKKFDIN